MSKSRGEELLEALVNGEDSDIKPQSRMEEYLLAAVKKSGTDGLPKPISRGDALLHQLVDVVSNSSGGGGEEGEVSTVAKLISGKTTEVDDSVFEGITHIEGYGVFYYNRRITKVCVPETITSWGDYAFAGCDKLTDVKIMTGDVGHYAFSSCKELKTVQLSKNTKTIGMYSFYNCKKLETIDLSNVTRLCQDAFSQCMSLISANIENVTDVDNSAFVSCAKLSEVKLSSNLTRVGSYGFAYCVALTSITFPASVTEIGSNALKVGEETNKATITFLGTTPPTITTSTFETARLNKIIVPAGCGDAYKSATNWSNFADYIEEATA